MIGEIIIFDIAPNVWKVSKCRVFSGPNTGNTDQKKLCIWTLITHYVFNHLMTIGI